MVQVLSCRECSIAATHHLSNSMHKVIAAASHGAHTPPSIMHSAQDAIAAIYYLLQLHGSFMADSGPAGHAAISAAAEAMITSLRVWPWMQDIKPVLAIHAFCECVGQHCLQSSLASPLAITTPHSTCHFHVKAAFPSLQHQPEHSSLHSSDSMSKHCDEVNEVVQMLLLLLLLLPCCLFPCQHLSPSN